MATGIEIIVGTYEEFMLGYRVRPSRTNTRKYDFFQTFSTHSHTSSIRSVAVNGRFAASGGADDRICIYDLEKRREVEDLFLHDGTINTCAFVPDGSYLMTGGNDGKILFVKSSNWKIDKVFERAHKGSAVNHISIHPSGKLALSLGADLTLRTWNLINGRQAFVTSLKNKSLGNVIDIVEWSPTGDYFTIAGKDSVEIWDTKQAHVVATKVCESRPTAVAWISDQDLLVGMENGKVLLFNWEDSEEEATLCEIYETRIKAMKYLNGFLATASSGGELNLWKIETGDKVEIEMIAGIDAGCRLICLDILNLSDAGLEHEIKDEVDEEEKKTEVRRLKTSGVVTIEMDDDEEIDATPKKNQTTKKRKNMDRKNQTPNNTKKTPDHNSLGNSSKKKKHNRKSTGVRLTNGFVEEDC